MIDVRVTMRHPLAPIAAVVVAIGLFAAMDALMKRAAIATGVYPALLARSLLGALVLAPVWRWRSGPGAWPRGALLRLHALRGAVVAGMAAGYFWGIVRTPLAEAIAISFIAPLLALVLAAALLGERLRHQAVVGSLVALAGVGVIAAGRMGAAGGPGSGQASAEAGWGIAAILGSAVLYAWNIVLQRRQAQLAGPLEVALFQNLFVALTMVAALPAALAVGAGPWPALTIPAAPALPDIAWAALLASGSVMLLAWAYARAEAQTLVPLEYTAFPWSALAGWWWFAEPVTGPTLAGLALIMLGVWIGGRARGPLPQAQLPPA